VPSPRQAVAARNLATKPDQAAALAAATPTTRLGRTRGRTGQTRGSPGEEVARAAGDRNVRTADAVLLRVLEASLIARGSRNVPLDITGGQKAQLSDCPVDGMVMRRLQELELLQPTSENGKSHDLRQAKICIGDTTRQP